MTLDGLLGDRIVSKFALDKRKVAPGMRVIRLDGDRVLRWSSNASGPVYTTLALSP